MARLPVTQKMIALICSFALGGGLAWGEATPAKAVVPWILGIARFAPVSSAESSSPLLDVLPRLVIARLVSLPPRIAPIDESREAAMLADLRACFAAGGDLAARLDARALRFLSPGNTSTLATELAAADKQVDDAAKRLAQTGSAKGVPDPSRIARLWNGHGKGELIELASAKPGTAAKASSLDLLVSGTISFQAGYAIVRISAYDASLEREVLAWRGVCSVDDPAPLAEEIAAKIERLVAGRDFARVSLTPDPPSSVLRLGGQLLPEGMRTSYLFSPGQIVVEAESPGHASAALSLDIALGERKEAAITLAPLSIGSAKIETDPPAAALSIDSIPIGKSPFDATLDGRRRVIAASAPGRERAEKVLPAEGQATIKLELLLADGLGPAGRVGVAKDSFYQAFGWFFLSLPVAVVSAGSFASYSDAAALAAAPASITISRNVSAVVLGLAAGASVGLAANAVFRLVKYLGTAQ